MKPHPAISPVHRTPEAARLERGRSLLEHLLNLPERGYVLAIDHGLTSDELRDLAIVAVAHLHPRTSVRAWALREGQRDG